MPVQGPTHFSPAGRLGYAELLIRHRLDLARGREINGARDLGASVVEWVVISALVIGVAIGVAAALRTKLVGTVNNLDTTGGGGGAGGGGNGP